MGPTSKGDEQEKERKEQDPPLTTDEVSATFHWGSSLLINSSGAAIFPASWSRQHLV